MLSSHVGGCRVKTQLTNAADRDLEQILEYGLDQFGLDQALDYFDRLQVHLRRLADNPHHFQRMDHVRAGYRRSVFGVHSIYFRIEADCLLVVRVLRSQQPGPALVEGEGS